MKNANYNLLKMLHNKLDDHWRVNKHYLKDAQGACKRCEGIFKKVMKNDEEMIGLLKAEMGKHIADKSFE